MRYLDADEASRYLLELGFEIGEWRQLTPRTDQDRIVWEERRAPKDARELHCFSMYVAGWLPPGAWKILQVDNSTSFSVVQASLIGSFLPRGMDFGVILKNAIPSVLWEFSGNGRDDVLVELNLVHLVFAFLLFEAHCYLISSESKDGSIIGLQDGYAYLGRFPVVGRNARDHFSQFDMAPLRIPEWLLGGIGTLDEAMNSAEEQGEGASEFRARE